MLKSDHRELRNSKVKFMWVGRLVGLDIWTLSILFDSDWYVMMSLSQVWTAMKVW